MNMFGHARHCLSQATTFEGRAGPAEFWSFVLFQIVCTICATAQLLLLSDAVSRLNIGPLPLILLLAILAGIAFWCAMATASVAVRRLHDCGRSGAWAFVILVPVIGLILFAALMALSGTPGPNRFGNRSGAAVEAQQSGQTATA